MKKIVKNGLIAILVVLLALCFVSCGGNDAGGNPAGGGSGSGGSGGGNGGGYAILDTEFDIDSDGSGFDFEVIYQNGLIAGLAGSADDTLCIAFTFKSAESTITADYFDKVMIQGAQTDITSSQYANGVLNFLIGTTEAGGLEEYLPSASTWYIDFSSESNPSRNMTLTVPSQYVTRIKEFINGWTPSPAGE